MKRVIFACIIVIAITVVLGLASLVVIAGDSVQERAALIAGLFGIVGILFGAIQALLGYLERRQQANLDAVFRALSQFEGGIQKRNVGISMLGHFWKQFPDYEGLFVRILTNQAIYVAAHGELDKAHELSNMTRIVDLLEPVKHKTEYKPFIAELVGELTKKANTLPAQSTSETVQQNKP